MDVRNPLKTCRSCGCDVLDSQRLCSSCLPRSALPATAANLARSLRETTIRRRIEKEKPD